jgi:flagellar hook assembly protein FlgD
VTIAHRGGAVVRHVPQVYYSHAGRKRVTWRRRNDHMRSVSRGMYTVTVNAVDSRGERVQTVRVIRVRRR